HRRLNGAALRLVCFLSRGRRQPGTQKPVDPATGAGGGLWTPRNPELQATRGGHLRIGIPGQIRAIVLAERRSVAVPPWANRLRRRRARTTQFGRAPPLSPNT